MSRGATICGESTARNGSSWHAWLERRWAGSKALGSAHHAAPHPARPRHCSTRRGAPRQLGGVGAPRGCARPGERSSTATRERPYGCRGMSMLAVRLRLLRHSQRLLRREAVNMGPAAKMALPIPAAAWRIASLAPRRSPAPLRRGPSSRRHQSSHRRHSKCGATRLWVDGRALSSSRHPTWVFPPRCALVPAHPLRHVDRHHHVPSVSLPASLHSSATRAVLAVRVRRQPTSPA